MTPNRGRKSTRRAGSRRVRPPGDVGHRRASSSQQASVLAALATLPEGPFATSASTAELVAREQGILLLLDGTESSFIDLADPAHLDFEYHQQMDAVLTVLTGAGAPVRAVHLGAGACALARAWHTTRPGSRQLAVEVDEVLACKVREWLDLPRSPSLRIRVGDASEVVPALRRGAWDVVVRDVFAAGEVPASCRTGQFLASCAAALAPAGVLMVNTPSVPRARAGAEISAIAAAFGGVVVVADAAVARGRRRGNIVVVARREPFTPNQREELDLAVRRLPLPVRTWEPDDPALRVRSPRS